MTVFHEPFLRAYYANHTARTVPMLDADAAAYPDDYPSVQAMVLRAAKDRPVFFKDMSYYVTPCLSTLNGFFSQLQHVFLIRDLRRALVSYHKLDPAFTLTEVGVEAQWRQYCHLRDALALHPIVIEAKAITRDPKSVLGRVWKVAGLPYVDSAFTWDAERPPKAWQYVEAWHQRAAQSTGIDAASRQGDDADEVFQAAVKKAPHLADYFDHHRPYYDRLVQAAQACG